MNHSSRVQSIRRNTQILQSKCIRAYALLQARTASTTSIPYRPSLYNASSTSNQSIATPIISSSSIIHHRNRPAATAHVTQTSWISSTTTTKLPNSTNNNNNDDTNTPSTCAATNVSIEKHVKRQRVPIHQTPRGKAAAKLKPNTQQQQQQESSIGNTKSATTPITSSTNHNPTHFVKGGTPCDPAPPPFTLATYGNESLYTLVLLRHGESQWNELNKYTGWCDVDLTERGKAEARAAGRLLKENEIQVDHAFTSVLKRANYTTSMALEYSDQHWVPVTKSWRLNERHYGALQGYNKDTAYEELGIDQELVMEMRRSYMTRPPRMEDEHEFWHGEDRRYKSLSEEALEKSRAESLKDTADRILPFFNSHIVPSLRSGNKCIIISHANTLRTLIKHIDNISDEDIKGMSIPTGIPLLYRLDKDLKPVDPKMEMEFRYMVEPKGYTWATSRQHGFHGVYLGDLERLQDIQKKRDSTNRDWQRIILRNVAKSLDEDNSGIVKVRQLYFHITKKIEVSEFKNMLLLVKMKDHLEDLMWNRKRDYLTLEAVDSILDKLHLDAEGHVVEPFVAMTDKEEREKRAEQWFEMLALDLEEECLIK